MSLPPNSVLGWQFHDCDWPHGIAEILQLRPQRSALSAVNGRLN